MRALIRLTLSIGALVLLGFVTAAHAMAPESEGSNWFCDRDRPAHDYESPFVRMPVLKPPPEGELPFGPRNLSMYRLNFGSRVVLSGGHLGYRFGAKGTEEELRTLRLNWRLRATLWEVDALGRRELQIGERSRVLREVNDIDELELPFPARSAGLYRVDTSFRNLGGTLLRSYAEYFRVVPRTVHVRVAFRDRVFRPGERVYARVENVGTDDVFAPGLLPIERAEGGSWLDVFEGQGRLDAAKSRRWWLGAGESTPCIRFHIPSDAIPGLYRFKVGVKPARRAGRTVLSPAFHIEP